MRLRLQHTRSLIAILAGAAALMLVGNSDVVAAPRAFSMMRGPAVKPMAVAPRKFVIPQRQFTPKLSKLPNQNLMVRTPRNPNGPAGIAANPNGPVVGKPPRDGNPTGPSGPGRPRPGRPGFGPVVIGTGVAIGTGVVIASPGPAGATPPPGAFAPPPGAFNPPGGPSGPTGPQGRINIPPANENRFVKNELVLEFSGNYSATEIAQFLARHRLTRLEQQSFTLSNSTYLRVRIVDGRPVRTVLRSLGGDITLRTGQPNYLFDASQAPATEKLPQLQPPPSAAPPPAPVTSQPAAVTPTMPQLQPSDLTPQATPAAAAAATLPGKGDPAQYALAKLRLEEAHRLALGTNVLVAVIDSGVDVSHPELDGVIADSYDTLDSAERPHKHGTAIAGAIVAHARLLGIAPAARVMAIRAFGSTRTSAEATTFAILKGLDYAATHGARIINMSFTGPYDPGMGRQLAAARAKGAVLIAAAGNLGPKSPPQYPAADANVIAVTATDAEDNLFKAANRGNHVAVAAPGVDILLPAPEGGYWMASGTSFAAAHVSGIVALILSRRPDLTPDAVQQVLLATARDLGAPGRDPQFGAGLADAYRAIMAVEQPVAMPTAASDANAAAR